MVTVAVTIEICPSCGTSTNKLVEFTGWCSKCSVHYGGCSICGASVNGDGHSKCKKCRREEWLTINGNEIERYIAAGYSFKGAVYIIGRQNETKINCLACGDLVKDARTFFCNRTIACKQAKNKLHYLRYYKGLPKELALKTVLESLL